MVELYEALKEAEHPAQRAQAAAPAMVDYNARCDKLGSRSTPGSPSEAQITMLKWITG